jgi:hypothetical protein
MRPTTDLAKLHSAFAYRLLRLRRLYGLARSAIEPRRSECLAIGTIELDNLILATLRALTISSLRCARTIDGHRVTVSQNFGHEEEIAAYMLRILEVKNYLRLKSPSRVKRKDEPTVRDPRRTEEIYLSCGASNIGSLQNALALNVSVFGDIPTVRNFYAHRNFDTWRKVRNQAAASGVFGISHPNEFLTASVGRGPVTFFDSWMDDAEWFFEEATK